MLTNTGTNDYKAPELILGAPYKQSIDIWSLGVLVFYCLSGRKPFEAEYLDELFEKISEAKVRFKGEIWKSISQEAKTFIGGCLAKTTFMRMPIDECLDHSWITGFRIDNMSMADFDLDSGGLTIKSYRSTGTFNDIDLMTEALDYRSPDIKPKPVKSKKVSIKENASHGNLTEKFKEFLDKRKAVSEQIPSINE
mmetsp:Transcript_11186/g.9562  ORF Transcript_11186/g.9562 Transcript_11186/m.9562 type:complete len:195 (-) Transcript_11186:139-723(-)